MSLDVMGVAEVAAFCGVHKVTVHKWIRAGRMPEPDARLAMGPVWLTARIKEWHETP